MKERSTLDKMRESLRLQQVYNELMRFGLDMALDRGVLGDFRRWMQNLLYDPPTPVVPLSPPVKTRLLLQQMGPTYVKIGQIISSRSESLPREWQDELDKLQSDVPPFPVEDVREIIQDELKATPEELFETFNPKPLAAASTAQVHRATLEGGQEVVVKVQRPNIQHEVKADLGILINAAGVLERRASYARDLDLVGILDEFGTNVIAELDYTGEAYNARRMAQNMLPIEGVHIPIVYSHLSSTRVMTQEFIDGAKINNLQAIEAAGFERRKLAEVTLRSLVKQLLIDGFFHADLHPGNVLVNLENGSVNYIDLGMVGEIDLNQRISLISLLLSIQRGETRGLAQTMFSLSVPFKEVDKKKYYRDFDRKVSRFMEPGSGASLGQSVNLAFDVLRENGLRLDSELTLAIKSLTQVDAIITTLLPEKGMVAMANEMVRELALEQVTAENVSKALTQQATEAAREVLGRVPTLQEATLKWLNQYEKGRFSLEIDTTDLNNSIEGIRGTFTLATVGILLAGMIIGSAFAASLSLATGAAVVDNALSYFASISFAVSVTIAFFIVFGILWRYWRNSRKKK